jgi:4-cresol dehydrogenase (hydroxylating)
MATAFPVSRTNPEVNRHSREAMQRVIEIGAKYGYGEYRASPVFQDAVMDTYSFSNHALRRFCEQLKDAVDPNGIIAAGRGGIWPKHLRTGGS